MLESHRRMGWLVIAVLLFVTRPLSGAESQTEVAKSLAQKFIYPSAKKFDEDPEGPSIYQVKLATEDSFNRINAWYSKTVGFQGLEGISFNPGQRFGVRLSVSDDSREPGETERAVGDRRPVLLKSFIKKTNDVIVVAVVSRGQDEKLTHIALTFIENKDK
jgi:hypothetical protein